MSRRQHNAANLDSCFPRVSGDEPEKPLSLVRGTEFSPRERG